MTSANRFDVLKLKLGEVVTDDATLLKVGALLGLKDFEVKGIKHNCNGNLVTTTNDVIRRWQGRHDTCDENQLADELEEIFKDDFLALRSDFVRIKGEIKQHYPETTPPGGKSTGTAHFSRQPPSDSAAAASGTSRDHSTGAHAPSGHIEMSDFDVPEIPERSRYNIRKYNKLGRVVIINNKNYVNGVREGTDVDAASIKQVTRNMGLELTDPSADSTDGLGQPEMFVLEDQGLIKIRDTLEKVSQMNHEDYACFCCFVLSHGNDRCVKTVDGATLSINDLTGYFKGDNCDSLVGKPKLFFIQACQGGRVDTGTMMGEQSDSIDDEERPLPSEADVFIFYATPFGYKSWRHPTKGSRFIQCLCSALDELHRDTEIMEIAAIVNEMVSQVEGESGYKQVSMVTSTLRKQFFFKHQRK